MKKPTNPPKLDPNCMVAALDVGDKRVGIAMTRIAVGLPQPTDTLVRDEHFWERLKSIADANEVAVWVVGLPRGMAGQETDQTKKVREFIAEMQTYFSQPVYLQDESLTSVNAEAELKARGARYNIAMVDALAAAIILEDFLREQRAVGVA